MRADRLLSILMILQAHGRTKAHELAGKLEVSERTIYRDIEALSAAGVPVYAERGPGGGCALIEGYRTTLTGLTGDEVRTLFLSGATHAMADLGLGSALDAAMLKLLATLPSVQRQQAERVRQRIHLDTANWNAAAEETPHLRTLQDAVWNDRKVRLTYHSREGAITERVVDPLGLVAKTSTWYFVAGNALGRRVFRVSRIQAATILDEPSERPEDFDLATFWEEWRDQFKASLVRYPVTLRITPEAVPMLPQIFGESVRQRVANAGLPDADGCWRLDYIFESFEVARSEVLRMGTLVKVIDPPELRDGVAAMARAIAQLYT
jgi:predicted DNA-binding transcriptional regulator YafY